MVKRILSCSGGGALGVIFAQILKRIQNELLREPIGKHLDYVCGCSVGSIICGYIATTPLDKFVNFDTILHKDFFMKAFSKRYASKIPLINLCLTGYKQKAKTEFLKSIFKDRKMEACYIPFSALAYNVSECRSKIFSSGNENDKQLFVSQVTNASSAAPTYFSPVRIDGNDFLDGAMASNNPSLAGILCSLKYFNEDLNTIKVLSIGYDQDIDYTESVSNWFKGSVYWIMDNRIIDILIDASSDLNNIVCKEFLKERYLRVSGRIERVRIDQLDDQTIKECKDLGNQWYEKNIVALYDFFGIPAPDGLEQNSSDVVE